MTALLYALTVLIWGTTWIAIRNELGRVSVEFSIVYRFALAGVVLFATLLLARRLRPVPLRNQPFVVLQGLCLFSCNFLCFYTATSFVPSGIVSVVFSAASVFKPCYPSGSRRTRRETRSASASTDRPEAGRTPSPRLRRPSSGGTLKRAASRTGRWPSSL